MASDDRRIPVWVPFATAIAGALVGFGLVTTLATDGDDTDTVLAAVEAPTTPTPTGDLEPVFLEPDERSTPTPEPTATPEPTPIPEATATVPPATAATAVPQPTSTPTAAAPAPQRPTAEPSTPEPATGSAISRRQAGSIAAAHVGGTVDSIERENDYGAAWDVDVYAPDGEYTIYVSGTGEIVRIEGPFRD